MDKSKALWLGGAALGMIISTIGIARRRHPALHLAAGTALGAILVGSVGDATIERCNVGMWPCERRS